MGFIFTLAKMVKTVFIFVGNAILSILAWFTCWFGYYPLIFTIYVINFGIDYHKMPNGKDFRLIFKKFVKGFLFPKEENIRKIGYFFVLPLLKAEKEEDNPVTSMFSKYYSAKINNQKLQIAHEYIDSIHRKNTYFTMFTFLGLALIYVGIIEAINIMSGGLHLISGASLFTGVLSSGMHSTSGTSSLFFGLGGITYIIGYILDFIVSILTISALLMVFWCFREIKTQKHLNEYVEENLNLLVLTLENNYIDNVEMLEIIKISKQAVIESSNPMSEDDIFQKKIENNFKRLI